MTTEELDERRIVEVREFVVHTELLFSEVDAGA